MRTMRAALLDRYGPPEVLRLAEVERPEPRENEVLIRIHAALATPPDCAFRSARPFIARFFTGLTRPKFAILGDAIAGEVEAVGSKVRSFKPGDRVYGASDTDFGAYAEYIRLPEASVLAPIPPEMTCAEAVAVSEGFITAMPFLRDEARLQAGQRLCVNGASGSIGAAAVQLGKMTGAVVTGVTSTRNLELVRSLGADRVIDYTQQDFAAETGAYDVIFDAVGKASFSRCRRALREGGVYMTTVPSAGILWHMLARRGARKRALLATTGLRPVSDKARDLLLLNELIGAGKIRPVIDRTYPLAAIAEAHRYVETGRKRGSVVISIADADRRQSAAWPRS